MKRELKVLIILLLVFEFAYLFRFIADLIPNFTFVRKECQYTILIPFHGKKIKEVIDFDNCPYAPFFWWVFEDASYIFEGMSYLSLLIFHYRNFQTPLK